MTIGLLIFVICIASLLGIFGIGLIGRNEGISFWKFAFAGSYVYRDLPKYLKTKYIKAFKISSWLYLVSFIALIAHIVVMGS